MISISPPIVNSSQTDYYLTLSLTGYYASREEDPGYWTGKGAVLLGLAGAVNRDALKNLFEGFDPTGGAKLVQNAGKPDRKKAHDLVCSPPKSVSVLWAMSDAKARRAIETIHDDAVQAAVRFFEKNAAFTRRGKGGQTMEKASLVIACFRHATSRNLDPQLHTHLVLLNLGVRKDGTTGALWDHEFYALRRKADLIYNAHLALGLRLELALKLEVDGEAFHIKGVSKKVCEHFSSRRVQILKFMAGEKASGAKAASVAALETRAAKEHLSVERLFPEWHRVGENLGWGPKEAECVNRDREVLRMLDRLEKLEKEENADGGMHVSQESWKAWNKSKLAKPMEIRAEPAASKMQKAEKPRPKHAFGEHHSPRVDENEKSRNKPPPFSRAKRGQQNIYTLKHRRWGNILWKANLGILEIRVQMKRPFRRAWSINRASGVELPALRVVPWRIKFFDSVPPHKRPNPKTLWKKSFPFSELRLEKAQMFPDSPAWSPAQRIRFPRLKFELKSKTLAKETELEAHRRAQAIQRDY